MSPILKTLVNKNSNIHILTNKSKGGASGLFKDYSCTVWDIPAGGFVESILYQVPSFSISTPDFIRFHPTAKETIKQLEKNQILAKSGIELAKNVIDYLESPEKWLACSKKNKAIDSFMDKFIKTNPNWVHEWKSFFKSIKT